MTLQNPTLWDLIADVPDPRVEKYFMMDGPGKTIAAVIGYVLLVKLILPAYMKNREPYKLKTFMLLYNVVSVCLSLWMFLQFGINGYFSKYNWQCEPVDFSNNEDALKVLFLCYVYFITKFLEFLDTVMFVLRKKDNQVTGLHVYHHVMIVLTTYICVKYGGGGYNTFYMLLNSFVHTWMYLYYALSSMGPHMHKYLWWKRYITQLQLGQFMVGIVFYVQAWIFSPKSCGFSKFQTIPSFFMGAHLLILFRNFYKRSYTKTA